MDFIYIHLWFYVQLAQKILNGLYPASPKVKCEPLPFLANGSIQPADCGVRPQEEGSKCTFQCNNGYSLKKPGRTSTVCKKAKLYIPSTIKRLMPLILGITFQMEIPISKHILCSFVSMYIETLSPTEIFMSPSPYFFFHSIFGIYNFAKRVNGNTMAVHRGAVNLISLNLLLCVLLTLLSLCQGVRPVQSTS